MVSKYPLTVNGVQFGHLVERDSYVTTLSPVRSKSVTTMDGMVHFVVIGYRRSLKLRLNPMPMATLAAFVAAFHPGIVSVTYYHQQLNAEITEPMTLSATSASYLSRCLAGGDKWTELDSITIEGTGVY